MSFRRHYGTGSYSSSLLSSPLSSSYGSRGLGGYSSYSPSTHSYSSYGGVGGYYGAGKSRLNRSASLPRDSRGSSVPRYSSAYSRASSPSRTIRPAYSRGSSPTRTSHLITNGRLSRFEQESSDSSSSGVDSPSNPVRRSNSNKSEYTRNSLTTSTLVPRAYSRDYGTVYSNTKGFIRSSRSKSVGSTSSLSSGYGSNSGVSSLSAAVFSSCRSPGLGRGVQPRRTNEVSSLFSLIYEQTLLPCYVEGKFIHRCTSFHQVY